MIVNCSLCKVEMIIDEPKGIPYIAEGLIVEYNQDGTIKTIDDSKRTIKHVECFI